MEIDAGIGSELVMAGTRVNRLTANRHGRRAVGQPDTVSRRAALASGKDNTHRFAAIPSLRRAAKLDLHADVFYHSQGGNRVATEENFRCRKSKRDKLYASYWSRTRAKMRSW
ncbi:MAG TPA: hypothetical protein VMK05_00085 [Burkholderiales bacterium]|nr:hypothetical protein [Burkholderiales bacterium]